jgi:hypothetical protein
MSDDEADPELLELLRKSLGLGSREPSAAPAETKVLENARYVFDNAIDVAIDPRGTKEAAETIWRLMQQKQYTAKTWAQHELHPKAKDESTVDFILTMDLLNFSFWSDESDESKRFAIEYRGKRWTGYWSLVAALQRALDEGMFVLLFPWNVTCAMQRGNKPRLTLAEIPITSPSFWLNEDELTEDLLRHVFRSATDEQIPLFEERLECLREAGRVLDEVMAHPFVLCHDFR